MTLYDVYVDGSCDNNSKLKIMSVGAAVIFDGQQTGFESSKVVGTNGNSYIAEWHALLNGLELSLKFLQQHPNAHLRLRGDNQTVVKQYNGEYRIRHDWAFDMFMDAKEIELTMMGAMIGLEWIPREQNTVADRLANLAILDFISNFK